MNKKTFDTFIFDWDGTLAMSLHNWIIAWQLTMKEYGYEYSEEEAAAKVYFDWHLSLPQLGINIDEFRDKIYAHGFPLNSKVTLYKNARKTLDSLKSKGKKLAVVTTSKKSTLYPALDHNHLDFFFDTVISQDDVTEKKPHPEGILEAMKFLNADPKTSVMIGDNKSDILGGKAAKISTAIIYPPENQKIYKESDLKKLKPDYFFTEISQVLTLSS